jgi:hypothetical protein
MRKDKALINLLQGLVALVEEEAARNPIFASKLETLLAPLPVKSVKARKASTARTAVALPDIYAELEARGEDEFRLWLRDQPIEIMRALIKRHELDPSRRTSRWKEAEKIGAFIADHLQSRKARGAAFMRGNAT